jgi:hypothetical protein
MRHFRYLMIVLLLMLAACGGAEETLPTQVTANGETDVIEPPTDGSSSFDEEIDALLSGATPEQVVLPTVDPELEGALPVPLPGTLVASETEEPEPFLGVFTFIYFEQTGGAEDVNIIVEIYGDGRVVSNGRTFQVDQSVIRQLDQMITELNFFGMQGTFLGPPGSPSDYRYRVAIGRGELERAVQAQDGFIPVELTRFLGMIRETGDLVTGG